LAEVASRADGTQAHQAHEPGDTLLVDLVASGAKRLRHARRTEKGPVGIETIDLPHEFQVQRRLAGRFGIEGRTRQTNQFALASDGNAGMTAVD